MLKDKLLTKSLRDVILEFEHVVLANSGVNSFEEIFKLIFTKLFDELQSGSDKDELIPQLKHVSLEDIDDKNFRALEFRNSGTDSDVKKRLEKLFEGARQRWEGIFPEQCSFALTPYHLNTCVSYLQDVKLFNSNLEVVDEAFEYLVNQESKGNRGQYFTPRYVIDACVKMLNPKSHETLIDTAAGSCGFPMHAIFHVWQQLNPDGINLFTTEKRTPAQKAYVQDKVFAIDFDTRVVRVGRTLNLIAGDGQTNVIELNTLDFKRWNHTVNQSSWIDIYNDGFKKLKRLRAKGGEDDDYSSFEFDVLMANPPFAGEITDGTLLSNYQLGKNAAGKKQTKVGRDVLFIERNLNFLKSGGRMAVVLPQGRFNNSSDKYIREYIAQHCRILAVIGLHGNVFKPHTGTKTSVLLVQKWDADICPKVDDYPIFFATMQKPSKDNSGEKIYLKNDDGGLRLDNHGHFIVDHDLFNHDGLTQDGIAEAFVEFAKKENLSFFDSSPFDEVKYRALLEGLEIRETLLSETLENKDFRTDSDFYTKAPRINSKLKYVPIGEILLNSQYGISIEMNEENKGYPIFRMNEIHNMLCDLKVNKSADIDYAEFKKFELKNRDVLFNRTNSFEWVGRTGIFYEQENKDFIFASYLVRFVPNQKFVLPEYLTAFLNTSFGIWDIKRRARHSINQTNVNPEEVKAIQIPLLGIDFQNKLKNCFDEANQHRILSQSLYSQAENLLLDALGMANFSPSNENINIKSFKDSFLTTGRLDAEYYQPKYEEMMAHISAQNHEKLSALVTVQKSIETGSDAYTEDENGMPYLRVADYNKFGITEPQKKLTDSFVADNFEKLENLKPKAGTILFSKDGSVGEAYCLQKDADFITSGAVLHLTVHDKEKVLPDYLTLTLNSKLVKMQAERDAGGSIILHWRVGEIENVIVPIVEMEIQTKIADLVQQSFALKAESETLLELAKRAVEMAIEEDEAAALEFINEEMK